MEKNMWRIKVGTRRDKSARYRYGSVTVYGESEEIAQEKVIECYKRKGLEVVTSTMNNVVC